jgi:hypothetical protein
MPEQIDKYFVVSPDAPTHSPTVATDSTSDITARPLNIHRPIRPIAAL